MPLSFFFLYFFFLLSSSNDCLNPQNDEILPVHWVMECGCTGMHLEAIQYILRLREMGVQVTTNVCGEDICLPSTKDTLDEISRDYFPNKKSIVITHYAWSGVCSLPESDKYDPQLHLVLSRSMFEASRITKDAVERCNSDEISLILLPSRFSEEAFILSGVRENKVHILPEVINTTLFSPNFEMTEEIEDSIDSLLKRSYNIFDSTERLFAHKNVKKTIFLSVFKFESRKNWQELVVAFAQLYKQRQDIVLLLKTSFYAGMSPPIWIEYQLYLKFGVTERLPIFILPDKLTEIEMRNLYFMSDCFVLPTRGEGWGLPIMEAMAMELPTITTNFGGQTSFAKEDNSYLIPVESFSPAFEGDGGLTDVAAGQWANPSFAHLFQYMRNVLSSPHMAKKRGEKARKAILEDFGEEKTMEKLMGLLRKLSFEWASETREMDSCWEDGGVLLE